MTPADDGDADRSGGDAPERSGDGDEFQPSAGTPPDGEPAAGWPVALAGVTETVVATRGPNGRWNHAALGIEPAGGEERSGEGRGGEERGDEQRGDAATARTWGRTRTRRNLQERGEAYVQFGRDPIDFVAAALEVHETDDPILARTAAWARVEATTIDRAEENGTEVVTWRLEPAEAAVRDRAVPTLERGHSAVVEATVAASRLDVEAYDEGVLRERIAWLGDVVERCGSERDVAAFEWIDEIVGWRER